MNIYIYALLIKSDDKAMSRKKHTVIRPDGKNRDHEKTKADEDILQNEKGKLTTQLHDLNSKMKGLVADSNNYRQLLQNVREEHEKTRRDKVQLEDIVNGFEQGWNISHEDIFLTEQELGRGGVGHYQCGQIEGSC